MLGAAWTVLSPLAMIVVYTVIFAQVMRQQAAGQRIDLRLQHLPVRRRAQLGLFAEILTRAQTMFLEQANLIKKISFPRICLPLIVSSTHCSTSASSLACSGFSYYIWQLSGLGLPGHRAAAAAANPVRAGAGHDPRRAQCVFPRRRPVLHDFLQFWFWFTPIVYPRPSCRPRCARWLRSTRSPPSTAAYQQVLVSGSWPDWGSLAPAAVLTVLLCGLAAPVSQARRRNGG